MLPYARRGRLGAKNPTLSADVSLRGASEVGRVGVAHAVQSDALRKENHMLIIARRKGERVVVGHDIEVFITDISRNSVKLGFRAPRSCTILRGEVMESIERENRAAASASVDEALRSLEKAANR